MDRVLEKTDQNGPIPKHAPHLGPCWLWTRSLRNGYPWIYYQGRPRAAYRVSYIETIGPIPDGLHLDHLCRITHCVNPYHLEPVTQAENNRRQFAVVTHCPQGHPYTPDNTYRFACTNSRVCKTCAKHRADVNRRSLPERECQVCGKTYKPGDSRTRSCSRSCAYQLRHLAAS
jgi:hypothetical protein